MIFRQITPIAALLLLLLAACSEKPSDLYDISQLGPEEVAVSATIPVSRQLQPTSPLGVAFSQDLAPAGYEPGSYLDRPPAALAPEIAGLWKWASPSRLEFVPDEPYRPNTQYKLTLQADIATQAALTFRGPRSFTFAAEPFAITAAQIFRERVAGPERRYLIFGNVEFNYPVDPEALAAALTLELERRGPVSFTVQQTAPQRSLQFRSEPIPAGDRNELITATVRAGLEAAVGDVSLARNESRSTNVPAIERLAIERMQMDSSRERRLLRIDVSDEVAPDDLRGALEIEPAVTDLAISSEGRRLYLSGQWEFGQSYQVRISAELRSASGLVLERKFSRTIRVDDLQPHLQIAGAGNYLSLQGERKLAIETINLDKLTVELDRVFANNLVFFLHAESFGGPRAGWRYGQYGRRQLDSYGENLYRRDMQVASSERNRLAITPLSLAEILAGDSRGIFRLSVYKEDERRLADAKWIVATDLGLIAKKSDSELLVAVASIQDLKPLAGVTVQLFSYNNQQIAAGKTDAQGLIAMELPPADSQGGRPLLVVATLGDDLSFLSFEDTRIPTGDLDVGGISHPTSGYRAHLYTDRGIYRPGDTAHLAWIVRDVRRRVPEEFPLALRILSPSRREFTTARVSSGLAGSGEFTWEIPAWARTGSYAVELRLDERTVIGRAALRVEDFIPDRMKVSLDLLVDGNRPRLARPGDTVQIRAEAMTLFGPPAAGRQARASLSYAQATIQFDRWRDFRFGDPDPERNFGGRKLSAIATDADGLAEWRIVLPPMPDFCGWVRADVEVEVTELGGGRIKQAGRSLLVAPLERAVGLRRLKEADSDYAQPGEPITFEAVIVDLAGEPVTAAQAVMRIYRKQWRTVLRKDPQGRYRYVSEYDEQLQSERPVTLQADRNRLEVTVDSHGSYRLVIEAGDGGGPVRGSLDFYVYGWGYSPWAMSQPEKVNIKLDKETYRAGETVSASLEAPFAGLLLLTIERDRVLYRQWLRLESNTATVKIPLPGDMEPNAYLVATLLRPLDSLEQHAPARAFGATPVFIDRSASALSVELSAPESTRPRGRLPIEFSVDNLPAGRTAKVTIAAVDEGILQITDFATPSPLDFFLQRRRLNTASFDIWALLLPEYTTILRHSSAGGGEMELAESLMDMPAGLLSPITARRVKPVALWSGIVDGTARRNTVRFEVPEFNGALRIMAVAAAADRFGSSERRVLVKDPIVLSPNLPRFLAPGDEIAVPVQVYNGVAAPTGQSSPVLVAAAASGPVVIDGTTSRQIDIPFEQEQVVVFQAKAADEIGTATFTFSGEAADEKATVAVEMSVRPPQPHDVAVTSGVVRAGESLAAEVSDRWYAGTGRVTVSVSPLPIAQFGAALPYLLRYPYGCIEQKTSRGFPLLYFAELAARLDPDSFGARDADYFVNSSIDYLVAMFIPERGFATWPGAAAAAINAWASVYATHFLVEASRKDFIVPDHVLEGSLRLLGKLARSSDGVWDRNWSRRHRLSTRAYAAYVLALAGQPERGAMDFLAQNELASLSLASRAHLAGAYGLTGNRQMMQSILPAQEAPRQRERSSGYSWHSPARDEAILLDVLVTVDPQNQQIPVIVQRLGEHAKNGRWHNTQENGFALLALGKFIALGRSRFAAGEILVDGEVRATFGDGEGSDDSGVVLHGEDWGGSDIEIRATSPGVAYCSIVDEGVPRDRAPEHVNEGLLVTRTYFGPSGERIDPENIPQGAVVICRLGLSSTKGRVGNVVISDLVPAGLEIENPRLSGQPDSEWLKQRQSDRRRPLDVEHLEIRDDRLLLFTTAEPERREYHYGLRAVTVGRFVLPPVRAEAMYDPDIRSVQDSGVVEIKSP